MQAFHQHILSYRFKPHVWEDKILTALPTNEKQKIDKLRESYPELADWDNRQLIEAKSRYFLEVYYADWIYEEREPEFLAWLYLLQEKDIQADHFRLLDGTIDRAAAELWKKYATDQVVKKSTPENQNAEDQDEALDFEK